MRANPRLITGINAYWIKFFVLAVFATMYVRDHCRPAFHKAVGVDLTDYDFAVFRLTSEISRQTFPLTLDLDNPAFKRGLDRLFAIARSIEQAQSQGGVMGGVEESRPQRGRLSGVRPPLCDAKQDQCAARRYPAFADRLVSPRTLAHGLPILATLVLSWASTGLILLLDGLDRRTFGPSMAAATAALA